jgi:hypothetical protein
MQTTNRQEAVTFTLVANVQNDVLGTVTPTLSNENFMCLNTGSYLHVTIDTTACAAAKTFRLFVQSVIGGAFAGPIAVYAVAKGGIETIDTSTLGPLVGYSVKLTCDPGAVVGEVIAVSARITA